MCQVGDICAHNIVMPALCTPGPQMPHIACVGIITQCTHDINFMDALMGEDGVYLKHVLCLI